MRPACAAIEIAGDAGALERVFEHADVLLRRPHENRHLVEPDAARGLLQHTARDFHTLPAFAGSGKPYELAAALARRRRVVGKQITCEVTEVSLPDVFNELDGHPVRSFNHRRPHVAPWMNVLQKLDSFALQPSHR